MFGFTRRIERPAFGLVRYDTLTQLDGTLRDGPGIAEAAGTAAPSGMAFGRVLAGRARHRV